MNKIKLSIVVLNYNGLKFLSQTIKPLLNFDYRNYELIVVDNGSEDGSLAFLEEFKSLILIKNGRNLGYCMGKNIGIKKARGEYILLLDEDILIQDSKILSKLVSEYNRRSSIAFLSILLQEGTEERTSYYGGFMSYLNFYQNKLMKYQNILGSETFEAAAPDGGAFFCKRSLFEKIGYLDESQPYYIDVGDIGLRASILGYRNFVYCKSKVRHLGSVRRSNNKHWCWKYRYAFSGMARIVLKNSNLFNAILRLPLLFLFFIAKTLKQFLYRRDFCVMRAYFCSLAYFVINLRGTLNERKIIQSKRKNNRDSFLDIKAPNFEIKS